MLYVGREHRTHCSIDVKFAITQFLPRLLCFLNLVIIPHFIHHERVLTQFGLTTPENAQRRDSNSNCANVFDGLFTTTCSGVTIDIDSSWSSLKLKGLELVPATRFDHVSIVQTGRSESDAYFGASNTYRSIASRNRFLYSLGLVTVGRFLFPPAKPRSLIHDSNFLSHVYVRMQSMMPTTSSLRFSSIAIIKL